MTLSHPTSAILRRIIPQNILTSFFLVLLNYTYSQTATFSVNCGVIINQRPPVGINIPISSIDGNIDANGNLEQRFIDSYENSGLNLFRYPGGTVSTPFIWKNSIGPKHLRKRQVHGFGNINNNPSISSNFGLDEAARMAENAGGKIMPCLSVNISANDAADFVEYLNSPVGLNSNGGIDWAQERANNGHAAPYGIKFFEIGNEIGYIAMKLWSSWPSVGDENETDGAARYPLWTAGGSRTFTEQKAVKGAEWPDDSIRTDGVANESYNVKFPPVNLSFSLTVKIGATYSTAVTWTNVANFATSSATDKVFTINPSDGEIVFGNGINGAIPTANQYVFVNYTSGPHDGYNQLYDAMKQIDNTINITTPKISPTFNSRYQGYQRHSGLIKTAYDSIINNDGYLDQISKAFFFEKISYGRGLLECDQNTQVPNLPLTMSEVNLHSTTRLTENGINLKNTMATGLMQALTYMKGFNCKRISMMLTGIYESDLWNIGTSDSLDLYTLSVKFMNKNTFTDILNTTSENIGITPVYYPYNNPSIPILDTLGKLEAISSINSNSTCVSVIIANTEKTATQNAKIKLIGLPFTQYTVTAETYGGEGWNVERSTSTPTVNSIKTFTAFTKTGNTITITLPPASVTAFKMTKLINTGIQDVELNNALIYPNPTNDIIYFKNVSKNADVKLYSSVGQLLKTWGNISGNSISIEEFAKGFYLLQVDNNRIIKIVKQ